MADKVEIVDGKKITDKVIEFGREGLYMGLGVVSVVQENVQELARMNNWPHSTTSKVHSTRP